MPDDDGRFLGISVPELPWDREHVSDCPMTNTNEADRTSCVCESYPDEWRCVPVGGLPPVPQSTETETWTPWTPTLCIDFDGVIHRYSEGWQDGTIYDPPMDGAHDALRRLVALRFRLVILTARTDHGAVWNWLREHDLRRYISDVTNVKPGALAYIDDRAIRFHNWEQALNNLDLWV